MILGLGTDVVELERIATMLDKRGEAFIARISRPGEVRERQGAPLVQHIGGLFAAKEAVLKALGTGWAQGLTLRQVEVTRDALGRPGVALHETAYERCALLVNGGVPQTNPTPEAPSALPDGARLHLSISHERHYAVAVAVLEAGPIASLGRQDLPPKKPQ